MSPMQRRLEFIIFALILLGYGLVGTLYALRTPAWQAPDEPAHYNYIAQIAGASCCPVIEMGDWDNDYLEQLKSTRFNPNLTDQISTIEYEDHQPPLYYLLAALIYRLTEGWITALRLFSVVMGAGVVVCTYGVTRLLMPERPGVALSAMALAAYIPQHAAILASVNNDPLALLLVGVTLYLCCVYVTFKRTLAMPRYITLVFWIALVVLTLAIISGGGGTRWLLLPLLIAGGVFALGRTRDAALQWYTLLGLLIGLAFITKVTVYFLAAVAVLAVILRPVVIAARNPVVKNAGVALKIAGALGKLTPPSTKNTEKTTKQRWGWKFGWSLLRNAREVYAPVMRRSLREIVRGLALIIALASAFGLVWWVRNSAVYGFPDVLGLVAHDEVVVGQLRTSERMAQVGGFGPYLSAAVQTTFNSFWGQLGWMALPLPTWAYPRIGVLLIFAALGIVVDIVTLPRERKVPTAGQVIMSLLIALALLFSLAAYLYYNLSFYQMQGRYLFTGLIPFVVLVAAGLDAWMQLLKRGLNQTQPALAGYVIYITPLLVSAGFGAFNLWLIRYVLPFLAP